MTPRFLNLGDCALTIELDQAISPDAKAQVAALDAALAAAGLEGVIGTTQTFRSLTVHYDPLRVRNKDLRQAITDVLAGQDAAPETKANRWTFPVSYEGDDAPDLADVASATGLSQDRVIEAHSSRQYLVYMLGFLPGFPFMGDIDEALRLPRRSEPRVRVPAGSVAIAGQLTAIYPWESPGGWNLIGRCPVPLFDLARARPALLAANDRVGFSPVSAAEVKRIASALKGGELTVDSFCEVAS